MIYTIIFLSVSLAISLYVNYNLGSRVLRFQDTVDECLSAIDIQYQKMSEILQRPLFYDSPEIKAVVREIQASRDTLLVVAYELEGQAYNFENENEETKED